MTEGGAVLSVIHDAAEERLTGLLALIRREPERLTTADFATDPILPIASVEAARQLAAGVRELCGELVEVTSAESGDPACASALVTGPRGTVLIGCRVEMVPPHRIEELVLTPSTQGHNPYTLQPSRTVTRASTSPQVSDVVEPWLDNARRDLNLVGVVAAVYQGPRIVWSGSSGQHGSDDMSMPDPDTCVVRIGSVTKTMLTVRSLQLVEQGMLGLHDRVEDVLTSWPITGRHAGDLQVRHLLTHTGALEEPPEERYFVPQDRPEPELDEWLDRPVRLLGEPGREWSYSNVGMTLLGQLLTDVTGRDFESDLREHVFEPLDMQDTAFRLATTHQRSVMEPFVEGYEGVARIPAVHVGARAAGSVFSTIRDMGHWAGEVVAGARGAGALLSGEAWRECLAPTVPIPGTGMVMARGFLRVDDADEPVVWHNGALPGASTQFWVAPRSGLSLAVFANVSSPWRSMVLERRCLRLLRQLTGTAE